MDNTPFPRQSDMTGSASMPGLSSATTSGMDPSDTGTSGLGNTYTTTTGGAAHQTVERLASGASRWADRFDEKTRKLTDAPLRAWETSRTQVQDHPMQAIAASVVIGFLLGRLTASRGRHSDF